MDVNEEVDETVKELHTRKMLDAGMGAVDLAFMTATYWKALRSQGLGRQESTQLTSAWLLIMLNKKDAS